MVPSPVKTQQQVKLPQSSTRLQKRQAFVRVLHRVDKDAGFSLGFEGPIYAPGATMPREELPETLVVLECAGAVGPMVKRRRETTWILWRFDDQAREWREIAQASASNWEWAVSLRQPAFQALNANRTLYDVLDRGRELAAEIAEWIERKIENEPDAVKVNILTAVYDRIAGEIAKFAA